MMGGYQSTLGGNTAAETNMADNLTSAENASQMMHISESKGLLLTEQEGVGNALETEE